MIHIVAETGSTNRDLAARSIGEDRVAEGDWLIADRQTAGVGRSGRIWLDGAGNFMGSTIVRPRAGDPPPPTLAFVAGLAVHAVLVEALGSITNPAARPSPMDPFGADADVGAGVQPMGIYLKWPNDLLIGHAKLAGILLERQGDAVIVGIGVNLAQAPTLDGREAIALGDLGVSVPRDRFAALLAHRFALDLQRWRDFGLAPIIRRWLAAAHSVGTPLIVDDGDGRIAGCFAGLGDDGALRLRLDDGSVRDVRAGEVRLCVQGEG